MTVDTVPSSAHVEFGGSEIGVTPLRMNLPTAFFQPPMTIWARHLSAPLKLRLTLAGYVTKTVELGEGPNSWVSLNGANHFDYYLLKLAYTIKLDSETATPSNDAVAVATALEKLAQLRDKSVLTEEEFQKQKRRLLGETVSSPSTSASAPPTIDATHFCANLLVASTDGHKLDTLSSPLLPGATGPIVRCLWKQPAPNVPSLSFYVQCGLHDGPAACSMLGAQRVPSDAPEIICRATLQLESDYVFKNGCVATTSGSGDPGSASSLVEHVVREFILRHSG
ncbi:MAG TPA: SHOCT domain-containing protein [Thermoanaerobaculia bacterium]|jgi:hypothetical protein|nr:SHOCT domain-containing protein [Thermoanaerobaculia bacterium]